MIKLEIRRILGEENLKEYVKDLWKVMDLGTTCLYMIVLILRLLAFFEVRSCMLDAYQSTTLFFFAVSKTEYRKSYVLHWYILQKNVLIFL
jgi:hypothetical protein